MRFRDPFDEPKFRNEPEERDKPSWSELDKRKNRSRHVVQEEKPMPRFKAFADKRAETKAKQALHEFFQGKKSKEQKVAWKKVTEGGPSTFSSRASSYVEKFGLPREWDDLLRLLDHENADFIIRILDYMMELAPNETETRRDLLVGKLRVLRMEREEPPVLSRIENSIDSLQGT